MNNNTKETYTGTISSLFVDMLTIITDKYPGETDGWSGFANDYSAGNVSGRIRFTMGGNYFIAPLFVYRTSFQNKGAMFINGINTLDEVYNIFVGVKDDRGITTVYAIQNGVTTNMTSMVENVPYVLTLYWHEIPTD